MYTRDSIRATVLKSEETGKINWKAVRRGMIRLFQFQTQDEQRDKTTRHLNHVGFSAADAKAGAVIAQKILKGESLIGDEWIRAYRICKKHAGQLADYANRR